MIPPRAVFKVLCVAFCILAPLSCGKDVATPIDCGNAATISAPPEVPNLGGYPAQTNKTTITLFGTKSKNTDIGIDVNNTGSIVVVVAFDCLTTWAVDVNLSDGPNSIAIFSANRTGTSSSSTTISITLDTSPPDAPTSITSCNPVVSPCILSGSKLPGEAVFIDNRLVVEASTATTWSYDVTLTKADPDINTFNVQLQDAAGNKSAARPITVNFTGTPLAAPNLIFPLGNTGVVSQIPQFRWSGNTLLTYKIQVSTSVDFNTTIVDATITGLSYTPSPIPPGRYYWRVGRVDTSTSPSNIFYSPPRKVTIGQSLCDLNDDGYDDVVVGAYGNDAAGANAGKVYIYYGNSPFSPNNTANVVLTGEAAGDLFGISVACAGDVNGDGVSDLIVGAYLNDAGGKDAGRAYIFFGGPSLASKNARQADIILTGQADGDQFGLSVSTAGDVNGDDIDDVIIGAYQNDGGGFNSGRAYIYYGGTPMDTIPDVVLTGEVVLPGETTGDQFGIRVAWAGDVNGDGFDDVIVGADRADVGTLIDAGKAYIFYGGPNMAGRNAIDADVILSGEALDDAFASVSGAGDVNNDGFSDIVVGASAHKIPGGGETDCFDGIDNDGDGFTDRRDTDCQPVGRAYLFLGGPNLISKSASAADLILTGETAGDAFGFAVYTAGDLNGDGYADFLVGAFGKDGTASDGTNTLTVLDVGKVYLYNGGTPLDGNTDFTITGQSALNCNVSTQPCPLNNVITLSGQFGFSVWGGGDINGDGNQDIVVGSYLWDVGVVDYDLITGQARFGPTDEGRVYVFLGPPSTSTFRSTAENQPSTLKLTGEASTDGFGISIQ